MYKILIRDTVPEEETDTMNIIIDITCPQCQEKISQLYNDMMTCKLQESTSTVIVQLQQDNMIHDQFHINEVELER